MTKTQLFDKPQFRCLHYSQTVWFPNKVTSQGSRKVNDKVNNKNNTKLDDKKAKNEPEEKLTIFQRFKKTYKEHGKVLVGVHLLTSSVWFGTFFYAAKV